MTLINLVSGSNLERPRFGTCKLNEVDFSRCGCGGLGLILYATTLLGNMSALPYCSRLRNHTWDAQYMPLPLLEVFVK